LPFGGKEFQVKNRWHLLALFLALAVFATAQTAPPAPADAPKPSPDAEKPKTPAAPETPPAVKAFNDANKITDPKAKVVALEKWKKDFPKHAMQQAADANILSTLINKLPDQKAQIHKQVKAMVAGATVKQKPQVENQVANQLLDANLFLKDARSYAAKSVASMKEAVYVQDQKDAAAKRKQKDPPSEAELRTRFRELRASRLSTLGRVEVKLGHSEQGRKLLEESYQANPNQPAVAGVLGELAAKAGQDGKALDYLVAAKLSGRASAPASTALDTLYRKSHDGKLDGFDAMLDAEYRKRYPNPVHLEHYADTEKRSDRVVLAEVFTGAGCPPCVGADLAFDAASERYSHKDLAILMFHQHIPRPDPMTNLETTARFKFYKGGGVPTYYIDGYRENDWYGGDRGGAKELYEKFNPTIEKDLEKPAEAHISVAASAAGNKVNVTAIVKGVNSESKDLKLQIVLAETELRYSGENGIRFHPMVVRALGGPKGEGFPVSGDNTFQQAFNLDDISAAIKEHLDDYEAKGHRSEPFKFSEKKYEIEHGNLAVVVFIQDEKTKHVLQAGFVDLSVPVEHRITESR
jgi:hypothetical protein